MKGRMFGRTGREVSETRSASASGIGANWCHVDETDAIGALRAALESGVTFIDTADVYGDCRSEQLNKGLAERDHLATRQAELADRSGVAKPAFSAAGVAAAASPDEADIAAAERV